MDSDQLKRRTKAFAHRCVKAAVSLPNTQLGRHLLGQLIRCSTSVAANYRAEFIVDEALLKEERIAPLLREANELKAIFVASRKTAQ
ncbi:MAG: hypothetical protein E2O78_06405 [Caldithrix sp.]|nr:MAG: hypothetical protein E2O78_06405 [Caldithrix sp.]